MDILDDPTAIIGITRPTPVTPPPTVERLLGEILHTLQRSQRSKDQEDMSQDMKEEWMMVALVLDRFFFFLFTAVSILVGLAILLNHH